MRLFISAGEPSGDLHGANLIRQLRRLEPGVEVHGMGGRRMEAAGCRLVYPLCDAAVVGFIQIFGHLPRFVRILRLADRWLARHRPDAMVLIDFPGFHWWLARRARAHNIPVYYFVPPQIWAWATWRAAKMRWLVDEALCTLPFEEAWFAGRGIRARTIGHPYFDELRAQRLDPDFLAAERARPGTVIGILPGSRGQELYYNLDSQLEAAALIHARRRETRFLVACYKEEHRRLVAERVRGLPLPIDVLVGRTPEVIELAHSCLAVSGSVSLELLFRGTPSVMIYRQHWFNIGLAHLLMRSKYITLVNLLADRELFPEYFGAGCLAGPMAHHVLEWLDRPEEHAALCAELAELRRRVAAPGACERAAEAILGNVRARQRRAA